MNKVMLIGNVGKEPEVRYYEADQAVAQLRSAPSGTISCFTEGLPNWWNNTSTKATNSM